MVPLVPEQLDGICGGGLKHFSCHYICILNSFILCYSEVSLCVKSPSYTSEKVSKVHFLDFKIFEYATVIILELNTARSDHKCSCYLEISQNCPNAEDAVSFLALH